MRKLAMLPIILELFGIAVIGSGIGIEIALKADIGYLMITSGSCIVAIGGVLWGKFMRRRE